MSFSFIVLFKLFHNLKNLWFINYKLWRGPQTVFKNIQPEWKKVNYKCSKKIKCQIKSIDWRLYLGLRKHTRTYYKINEIKHFYLKFLPSRQPKLTYIYRSASGRRRVLRVIRRWLGLSSCSSCGSASHLQECSTSKLFATLFR